MTTRDRRRLPRDETDPHSSLQHGVESWRLVQAAWRMRLQEAQASNNASELAAAQAKLEECERQIARLEKLLQEPRPSE